MKISFHPLGNEAMLINFEQRIDPVINLQVHTLAKIIEVARIPTINYITPAYCSLTIAFDKEQIGFSSLQKQVEKLMAEANNSTIAANRKLYIPVCYDRIFALDIDEIINQTGLSSSEIVEKHTSISFKVYMIGFLPGFPYLGKLPLDMECSRKANPRVEVPKGAVSLAGLQTGIYPAVSPGGWQVIGNTPVDVTSTIQEQPFLFQAGDEVQFYSISKSKYFSIIEEQKEGLFNWNNVYE